MRRDGRIRVMPIQRNQTTVGGRIGCAVVSVLVADAHDLAWIGLVMILDAQSAIQVIGEARDGHDAVRHAALRAEARGFQARRPRAARPDMHAQPAGRPDRAERHRPAAPHLRLRRRPPEPTTGAAQLSPGEEQVLRTVGSGPHQRRIAAQTHVSLGAVKAHIASLLIKLGVRNRPDGPSEIRRLLPRNWPEQRHRLRQTPDTIAATAATSSAEDVTGSGCWIDAERTAGSVKQKGG